MPNRNTMWSVPPLLVAVLAAASLPGCWLPVAHAAEGASPLTCLAGLSPDGDAGGYVWMTKANIRQQGQSLVGNHGRLRAALDRFKRGGNLTVTVVGGSISAGQGALDSYNFPQWTQVILNTAFQGHGAKRFKLINAAVPGTLSSYMSVCHNVHVPKESDIIFVEYAVNDLEMPMPHMDNQIRRPFERLLRKLLNYPNRPAVVLMNGFQWFQLQPFPGAFWTSAERQFSEFAMYYGIPALSVKACCYHLMKDGVPGFQVHKTRGDHHGHFQHAIDKELRGKVFYWDNVHPDGNTGHRVMGELAAQFVLDGWAGLALRPLGDADMKSMVEPLPPPMLPRNFESRVDKCFIGTQFTRSAVGKDGWEWKDEGKDPSRPKLGFVSTTPGTTLKIQVNTTSSSGSPTPPGAEAPAAPAPVTVELAYLKSYEHMGTANVTCESGCKCEPVVIDAHHEAKHSQLFLQQMKVSQHDKCVVAVTVQQGTRSGGHKFKVAGVMVTEEPQDDAFDNWAAVQLVHETASRSASGTYDAKNAV